VSIRIGIVNDVVFVVEALRRALAGKAHCQVVWIAHSGEEAIAMCARDTPDLLLMDLVMPGMGGVEATRRIMRDSPCAILIVTAGLERKAASVFEALGHGALDVVEVPPLGVAAHDDVNRLLSKIDTVHRLMGHRRTTPMGLAAVAAPPTWLLAIGASAGGPSALATLLGGLPLDLPAAIVLVQHIDARFAAGMADWLAQQCRWPVRLAHEGHCLTVGTVLLAGTSEHLVLKARDRLGYTADPIDHVYRPSIDVFLCTVNQVWEGRAIGVLLTGMGRDGAAGLKAMRAKGHHTIAQDQATSAVFGMPRAAAMIDAASEILPLPEIAPRLAQLVRKRI
jgi:chemotaxis response regulator CheB